MSEESVVSEKESQVVWHDPCQEEEMRMAVHRMNTDKTENLSEEKDRKVFLVSGIEDMTALTQRLGEAEMRISGEYDSHVTHILTNKVFRSEKLLCCIAAGKWVLHPRYITDSQEVCL